MMMGFELRRLNKETKKKKVRMCKIHGELTSDKLVPKGDGKYRCKVCHRDRVRKYYHKTKDRRLEVARKSRERNPESYGESRKKYYIKHGKKRAQKEREELTDSYVIRQLLKTKQVTRKDITPELIELKRMLIELKRRDQERG